MENKTGKMIFNSEENTAHLYGTIWSGDASYIVSDLKAFLKGKSEATIHLHSPGGSVFDGNLIYNALIQSKTKINIVIDGLAASMGSIIMLAGNTISIADNAFVMIHAPSGYVDGNASDMEKATKLLQSIEKQFITKYGKRTGKTEAEIKEWLTGENWFDAQQALDAGLVDSVVETVIDDLDFSAVQEMNIAALFNSFDEKFTKQHNPINNNKNEDKMKLTAKSIQVLGLKENATEDEINAAITRFESMESENNRLKQEVKASNEARVKALLDPAVADGRITAKEREEWEALANSNFELAAKSIAKLTAKEVLPVGGKTPPANTDERKDWTFTDWSRKDTAGLLKMKSENPERYNALVAQTGVKL